MTKVLISDDEALLKKWHDEHSEEAVYFCLNSSTSGFIEKVEDIQTSFESVSSKMPKLMTEIYKRYPVKETTGEIDVIDINEDGTPIYKDGAVSTHKETAVVSVENTFEYTVLTSHPELYYINLCICDEANILSIKS